MTESNDAMADDKKVVANTYFQEPTGEEEPSNETDNGTD